VCAAIAVEEIRCTVNRSIMPGRSPKFAPISPKFAPVKFSVVLSVFSDRFSALPAGYLLAYLSWKGELYMLLGIRTIHSACLFRQATTLATSLTYIYWWLASITYFCMSSFR